ncbi:hypothetical protein CEXT_331981 [Caerostris extrusa]|uniref:Maturase K n=1 Tax=Caerostris extrusa TaxID=172846 RepID=A0AAV4VQF9_CAEEX|nr:hypothetical protein CEXT_331981 [Caerostris extrusa]
MNQILEESPRPSTDLEFLRRLPHHSTLFYGSLIYFQIEPSWEYRRNSFERVSRITNCKTYSQVHELIKICSDLFSSLF